MNIGTLYTLYGRRAGAEMFFEQTLKAMLAEKPAWQWTVFCNRAAHDQLASLALPVRLVAVPWLENQYKKAFWLEFLSQRDIRRHALDAFWNPSGCNHFPGRWPIPTLTTFLDLGEYRVEGKYGFARTVFRKAICIPRSVRRSKGFTAISQFTADDTRRFLGLGDVPCVYPGASPFGDDAPAAAATRDAAALLAERFSLAPGSYILTPGRTDYTGKGLDVLLAALEKWPNAKPAVLVGPRGEGHEQLEAHLARLSSGKPAPLATYLGRVTDDELAALYQCAWAVVLPSRFEGFGFPALEAMQHRIPLVASDAGSLPEVVGEAGLVFPSGDPDALATALRRLADDPALRDALIAKSQPQYSKFTWKKCAAGMLAALRRILPPA